MTKGELIEALEALDCSDETEVLDGEGFNITTVEEVHSENFTGTIPHIEVS